MINTNNPIKKALKGFKYFHTKVYNDFKEVYKERNIFTSIFFTITLLIWYPILLFSELEDVNSDLKITIIDKNK